MNFQMIEQEKDCGKHIVLFVMEQELNAGLRE